MGRSPSPLRARLDVREKVRRRVVCEARRAKEKKSGKSYSRTSGIWSDKSPSEVDDLAENLCSTRTRGRVALRRSALEPWAWL